MARLQQPRAKYNVAAPADCNLDLPLWQLVRASTAAPTYFPPEDRHPHRRGQPRFVFVDGGVTMYNNPAFQLFLMATVEPYKLGWPTGEDKMLLVSIGTGVSRQRQHQPHAREMNLLYNATFAPVGPHVRGLQRAGLPLPRLRQLSRTAA